MKILSGIWGGRTIKQPPSREVRPLSEKVRAALFDVYGDVSGAIVLDAYAGSGAAGLEALSRGASIVEALESDVKTARIIERNAKTLEANWGYLLTVIKVETWLAMPANQPQVGRSVERYDLIIADPPYARLDPDIIQRLLEFLKPGGVLVLSRSSKRPAPVLKSVELAVDKTYGDTSLSFYRRAE